MDCLHGLEIHLQKAKRDAVMVREARIRSVDLWSHITARHQRPGCRYCLQTLPFSTGLTLSNHVAVNHRTPAHITVGWLLPPCRPESSSANLSQLHCLAALPCCTALLHCLADVLLMSCECGLPSFRYENRV